MESNGGPPARHAAHFHIAPAHSMIPPSTSTVNVLHLVPMSNQPIRNQHALTMKVDSLRTHVSSARQLCQCNQLAHGSLELRRQHMVRVIAKTVIPQSDIG